MVYLLHLKISYYDLCFKFEYLENLVAFVERLKYARVPELSDQVDIRLTIEALTTEEFKEKIKETEE